MQSGSEDRNMRCSYGKARLQMTKRCAGRERIYVEPAEEEMEEEDGEGKDEETLEITSIAMAADEFYVFAPGGKSA